MQQAFTPTRNLIIAYERNHAFLVSGHALFTWIFSSYQLRGLKRGTCVTLVNAPRYEPTRHQSEQRREMLYLCKYLELTVNEVALP